MIRKPGFKDITNFDIKELVIGDMIRVIHEGLLYSQFNTWAESNGATNWKANRYPEDFFNVLFKVITIAPHTLPAMHGKIGNAKKLCLIEDLEGKQFIFEASGLAFVSHDVFFEKEEFIVL